MLSSLGLMMKNSYMVDSKLSEIFVIDFLIDENLKIWFLEINRRPELASFSKSRNESYVKLILDQTDISLSKLK